MKQLPPFLKISPQGSGFITLVISDDISSISLPRRLVTIAAPTQALLTLTHCSGCSVTFLLSLPLTNHNLLTIRLYRAKVVNSTRLYTEGPSRLPRCPNRILPKISPSVSQGRFFLQHRVALASLKENVLPRLLHSFCLLVTTLAATMRVVGTDQAYSLIKNTLEQVPWRQCT